MKRYMITSKQQLVRIRNWEIFRLRSLSSVVNLLAPEDREDFLRIIDNALLARDAAPQPSYKRKTSDDPHR